MIICPDRNFTFKLKSDNERNTLLALLADAATSEGARAMLYQRSGAYVFYSRHVLSTTDTCF